MKLRRKSLLSDDPHKREISKEEEGEYINMKQ
jgi:hypothetical protein